MSMLWTPSVPLPSNYYTTQEMYRYLNHIMIRFVSYSTHFQVPRWLSSAIAAYDSIYVCLMRFSHLVLRTTEVLYRIKHKSNGKTLPHSNGVQFTWAEFVVFFFFVFYERINVWKIENCPVVAVIRYLRRMFAMCFFLFISLGTVRVLVFSLDYFMQKSINFMCTVLEMRSFLFACHKHVQ